MYKRNINFLIWLDSDCNFRCKYCFERLDGYPQYKSDPMSYDTIDNIIKYIKHISVKEYNNLSYTPHIQIIFFGGEPLLHIDKIEYVINKTIENNLYLSYIIQTNGNTIDTNINKLVELEEKTNYHIKVRVSYDFYLQNIQRKDNTYNKIRNNIKLLLENNIPTSTSTKVLAKNLVYLDEIMADYIEFYNDISTSDSINFFIDSQIKIDKVKANNTDFQEVSREEYLQAFKLYYQYKKDFGSLFKNNKNDIVIFDNRKSEMGFSLGGKNIEMFSYDNKINRYDFSILPNGNLSLNNSRYTDYFLNINDYKNNYTSLSKTILEKCESYKLDPDASVCANCAYKDFCEAEYYDLVNDPVCEMFKYFGQINKEAIEYVESQSSEADNNL